MLRTTTVYPSKIAGGIVEINDHGIGRVVDVRVVLAGEQHIFRFHGNTVKRSVPLPFVDD